MSSARSSDVSGGSYAASDTIVTSTPARSFPTFAPCLEHICAGGGSVANMGRRIVIYEGILYYALELCLLVGMLWADVLS